MSELVFERPLPADTNAERLILGAVMVADSFGTIAGVLKPEDFILHAHRLIYAVMLALHEDGVPIDHVTVARGLMDAGKLEAAGGMTGIVELDEGLPKIVNLDAYVDIVRDKSVQRKTIYACQKTIDELISSGTTTAEALASCERVLTDLAGETIPSGLLTVQGVLDANGGEAAFLNRSATQRGIASPWSGLNQILLGGGFQPGQMVTIGARPSAGKTSLACNIALDACQHGYGTAIISLEMSDEEILRRLAGTHARVDLLGYSQGYGSDDDKYNLRRAYADLKDWETCKLWITSRCHTIPAMRAALCKIQAKHPLSLVILDYLQLTESGGNERSRVEQVSKMSRQVKRLAQELRVPFIVLSQLSREPDKEKRPPRLSDLRESGAIEQDSDLVMMPHLLPAVESSPIGYKDQPDVDLYVLKQRNGPEGKVPLRFHKRYTLFEER